jgi:hypothetical protein
MSTRLSATDTNSDNTQYRRFTLNSIQEFGFFCFILKTTLFEMSMELHFDSFNRTFNGTWWIVDVGLNALCTYEQIQVFQRNIPSPSQIPKMEAVLFRRLLPISPQGGTM